LPSQLILVSGLSGSGKSVALKALEDAGYFAVDNLPAPLIGGLLDWVDAEYVAVSVDARSASSLESLPETLAAAGQRGIDCRVVFLEASNAELTRRFSETRRPHPLAGRFNGIDACIAEERRLLAGVAELAHRLDTSGVATNTLRGWIKDWLKLDRSRITLAFESFGFKHGIPADADFVFDVRFLPNPFYDPALRALTGNDEPVMRFLQEDLNVQRLIDDVASFILRWLPAFMNDNRNAITIAIGCTGGQHRSVFVVNQLAERFGSGQQVLVRHRELGTG
jgi:RNase adapter protein RapZ